jgi:hypothetical protein
LVLDGPVQVTMKHVCWLKRKSKPKVMMSENVTTGNIEQRICEVLSDEMSSRDPWFTLIMSFIVPNAVF